MQIANRVRTFLERRHKSYALVPHGQRPSVSENPAATADTDHFVRAVLLEDSDGVLLALVPATHLIDFRALHDLTGRNLKPADPGRIKTIFSDCETGSVPPFGEAYGVDTVIDAQLATQGSLNFESGTHQNLLRMASHDFRSLFNDSARAVISRSLASLHSRDARDFMLPGELDKRPHFTDLRPVEDIRRAAEQVERLPTLPEMANRLLRLRNDSRATIEELTEIIQCDPGLTAQIIRYARSAFFGYRGNIDTLSQAITRVLGFETVLNMSLGLAASRTFHNPADGPLGLQAFWKHAAYSAALAQALAKAIGPRLPIKPGLAYLCGLLHNFGFLLAGHLFRAEFFLLNRVVAANPQVPVNLIERRVLGVEHTQTGGWLMSAWNMPDAVIVCNREHHNESYTGEHADYTQLIHCVDHLLRGHGLGDGTETQPPVALLNALGLDLTQAQDITRGILDSSESLDAMARQLAA